ncbi:MAG: SCO family protein [Pseudomonadota bacterium]
MAFGSGAMPKIAFGLALALGVSAGAVATVFEDDLTSLFKPAPETSHFEVDPTNTEGFPDIKGGDFALVDHNGSPRTSKNPNGQHQLLFFGYAKCKAICSMALPNMAEAVDLLDDMNMPVTPLLITVDPQRDTIVALKEATAKIHPKLIGLTGSDEDLDVAYKAFQMEKKLIFNHEHEGPVYAHGSFIFLLAPDGSFKTLFPPIIAPARIAEISAGYINEYRKRHIN